MQDFVLTRLELPNEKISAAAVKVQREGKFKTGGGGEIPAGIKLRRENRFGPSFGFPLSSLLLYCFHPDFWLGPQLGSNWGPVRPVWNT